MDKKLVSLVGAMAVLAPVAAVASPAVNLDDLTAASYADLLTPIPNAVAKLQASDALLQSQDNAAKLEMAQFYEHHHHHHRFFPRFYHHHHHHNFYRRRHHHNFYRRRYHHHHHHHHNFY